MTNYKRKVKIKIPEVRQHIYETKQILENGASRSASQYAYHLIPPCAIRAMADRWWLGMQKHGEGNWKHGGVNFIKQCFNHCISHYTKELESSYDTEIEKEDSDYGNLGALLWNAGALTWFKKYKRKEYNQALQELHEGLLEAKK